jgi:hypothetical protein
MSIYDTVMSDTVGVLYRAGTGNVDPWTKQEVIDDQTQAQIQAGADPTTAAAVAQQSVTSALDTFTEGGSDRVGADPSQTTGLSLPSSTAVGNAFHADDGSGCGLTNVAGCVPTLPTWVYWGIGAVGVLAVLWLVRPYIGLAESFRGN